MTDDLSNSRISGGCTQRAYLYFARDVDLTGPPYTPGDLALMAFNPDEITRLTGLRPTEIWLSEVHDYLTEEVVVRLLNAIQPYAEGIAMARRSLGMRAGIIVLITMHGDRSTDNGEPHVSTAAITYTSKTIRQLPR